MHTKSFQMTWKIKNNTVKLIPGILKMLQFKNCLHYKRIMFLIVTAEYAVAKITTIADNYR